MAQTLKSNSVTRNIESLHSFEGRFKSQIAQEIVITTWRIGY